MINSQTTSCGAYVVLLHSPMVNRHGAEVTTAVTNLDIHDIARSCKTYGILRYYIVNPSEQQEKLVGRILEHWKTEIYKVHHPSRAEALEIVSFRRTFIEAFNEVTTENNGITPFVVMPDAKQLKGAWSYDLLKEKVKNGDIQRPLMIIFGTGWGISPTFYSNVDCFLTPIMGNSNYNHLSVRAAVAVVLDKIFGS